MHHLACEYAKGLHLHSLDGNDYFAATGSTRTDDDRKGMWELIQKDLFYHLIYNKPATLYPSLDKWRVNLPWLSLDSPPENVDNVSTISFLVRSRLTFILIHFFHTLEKLEHESEAVGAIEPLCHEVELLFEEWGIVGTTGHLTRELGSLTPLTGKLDPTLPSRPDGSLDFGRACPCRLHLHHLHVAQGNSSQVELS